MDMTDTPALIAESGGEGVLLLRLNRPEKRNALATPLLRELERSLAEAATDDAIRCVVLNEIAAKDVAGALADPRPGIWSGIRLFPKPLLAAVEGWCLGAGNELLMCCDLAIAGAGARFGQPETNLGIMPGAGGTATLPRLVGRSAAMKMVLLGEPIDASTALALGLVAEVVDHGEAVARALALALMIARRAPIAMRQAKAMVHAAFDLPHQAHLAAERQSFAALFGSADKAEGIAAFFEKREPVWTGR